MLFFLSLNLSLTLPECWRDFSASCHVTFPGSGPPTRRWRKPTGSSVHRLQVPIRDGPLRHASGEGSETVLPGVSLCCPTSHRSTELCPADRPTPRRSENTNRR